MNAKWQRTEHQVKLAETCAKDRFDAVINLAELKLLLADRTTYGLIAICSFVVRW